MTNNLTVFKQEINSPAMNRRLLESLQTEEKTVSFKASLMELVSMDNKLVQCNPRDVIKEALKAGILNLPLNKNLGWAYVIAYGRTPQFQMGYKGYIQLAMRTGYYKFINAAAVYSNQTFKYDYIRGVVQDFGGEIPIEDDEPIGYFATFGLINGFEKATYWSREDIKKHAIRFSKSFKSGPWQTDFDAMAKKTLLKEILSKYGMMSVDMISAYSEDTKELELYNDDEPGIDIEEDVIDIEESNPEVDENGDELFT
jgi:recombination protein RecT